LLTGRTDNRLKLETVIRWHRAGIQAYWRWKPRPHVAALWSPDTPANYDYSRGSSRHLGDVHSNQCSR